MPLTNHKRLAVLIGVLAAAGLTIVQRPTRPAGPNALSAAPDFQLADLDGRVRTLSSYHGKGVLVNFWATWCDSCKQEMPELNRLQAKFKDRGFTVLALSVDEGGRKPVLAFASRYNLDFPLVLSDRKTAEAYGVFGLPASFLIDRAGRIRSRYVGPVYGPAVENDILTLALQGDPK
jgi:peroxiredoxin